MSLRRRNGNPAPLIDVQPRDGFVWRTIWGQKRLLSNAECRMVTSHMKSLLPAYTKPHVETAIVKMFSAATSQFTGPISCSNTEFWGQVKTMVVWLRGMGNEDITKFSWKVLSARCVALEIHDTNLESALNPSDVPAEIKGVAAEAVDAFISKLRNTQTSEVYNELFPRWTRDEFNQGDEASTNAAFLQVGISLILISMSPAFCL